MEWLSVNLLHSWSLNSTSKQFCLSLLASQASCGCENISQFNFIWWHFTDNRHASDTANGFLHWHSFGEPAHHNFWGSFTDYFLAWITITLFHMIAYFNLSLRYKIIKAHSATILRHAFMVRDDTLDAKHSISKLIAKQACQQVITFLV